MWCGELGSADARESVWIAWHVFVLTRSPFDLGLVGLMVFLPSFLFVLISGFIADRFNRRSTPVGGRCCELACALGFLGLISARVGNVWAYLGIVFILGTARALAGPAQRSILPNIVAPQRFMQAQATYSTARQFSVVGGPALGGALIAVSATAAFATAAGFALVAVASFSLLRLPQAVRALEGRSWSTILAGFRYIRTQPVVLGAISLDLFAVLLGGAVALLPVYAREILKAGATGLGILRAAPGVGAVAMAIVVAHWPLRRRAGEIMLWCVLGFGIFTIVFGVSHNMTLSLAALVIAGACDMISIIVRQTMVQLATPDRMRGRVSAVNMLFVGASNELGQFESGITAQWFGTVPAVILGGTVTLTIAAVWGAFFPALRNADLIAQEPV